MIGIFDSGLGGLTVTRAIHDRMPHADLIYLADSAYCPYGPRPVEEIRARALACGRWLVDQGARIVVVACNTATAAAIELLRRELPVPVVGMEPGVKPAVAATRRGKVAVMATSGTLASDRFRALVNAYAADVEVYALACPDLVEQVEAGAISDEQTRMLIAGHLAAAPDADVIVLGCTHFPPLTPLISACAGPAVTIIDTGPAVAAQTARVAERIGLPDGSGALRCYTTGDPQAIAPALANVWGEALPLIGVEIPS
ncbi:glutamate racemase [Chloroflexus islandicus]|uniref:Glutamate racemase n=1 Tax=Chloroflexus islandicus TaxID=1707952 RepID=A0A178M9U7_9CHLR|nr:glutamate racemase [Chloroflexus islandicus]OAN44977.1 glutamate racemase [Chloroflexus islandicus]